MHAIERAEGYRLLAAGLRYPSDPDLAGLFAEMAEAPGDLRAFADLAPLVDGDLPGEYNRLFATSVAVSPYQSSYVRVDKGATVGQLAALYGAFGVKAGAGEHEIPDHAGVEAEFMAMLALMEGLAEGEGRTDDHAAISRAREVFAREHMGRWFVRFGTTLTERAEHPFYTRLGQLAAAWMAADMDDHGWNAEPSLEPLPDDGGEIVCPVGAR
ncbi:MAG: molecular chaperone TorD family protein [Deltaproteobacteria bacterium]|nr:molecular chaperone TorD family protein [Deltaproteobacteria bacterium]